MVGGVDVDKLSAIGFYTLSDNRAMCASEHSRLWRCELILTDKCNFKCPYCRGLRDDIKGTISYNDALSIVNYWAENGLKNIRFSGGEPTIYPHLLTLVKHTKAVGIERIAISSNGSADTNYYKQLINAGVNDVSFSLDACCSAFGNKMAGGINVFNTIANNIKEVSKIIYTTVGIVVTEDNLQELHKIVDYADGLGVSDIRVISAAQLSKVVPTLSLVKDSLLTQYPILKYRVTNAISGRAVRGITESDSRGCGLVLDDMAIAGNYHFPCIIYMREGGDPIGKVSANMRKERARWYKQHDTHRDNICKNNCLDVCIDYNNTFARGKLLNEGSTTDHQASFTE